MCFLFPTNLKINPPKSIQNYQNDLTVTIITKSKTAFVHLAFKVMRVLEDIATNQDLHKKSSESVSNLVIEIINIAASVNRPIHSMVSGPLKDLDDKII